MWSVAPMQIQREVDGQQSMINVDFDFYNLNEEVDQ